MNDEPEQPMPAPPEKKRGRSYKSEAYMVAIDQAWFLSKDDWTEQPSFGKKYSRAKLADTDAEAERNRHPSKHIRVVKVKQTITVYEIEE